MDIQQKKRLILIITTIGIAALVLFFIASALRPPARRPIPEREAPTTGGTTPRDRIPSIGREGPIGIPSEEKTPAMAEERLKQLSTFPTISPSLSKNEDAILFYKKEGGDLFRSDFDGKNQEKVSNITIIGLVEALWSPTADRAVVSYLDDETLKSFIHIGTSSTAALPPNLESAAWSPDGKSLAYLTEREGSLELFVTDSSGRGARRILQVPLREVHLKWITADVITLTTTASGRAPGFLFTFSRSSGILQKLVGPRWGLAVQWSPDGTATLASYTAGSTGKNLAAVVWGRRGEEIYNPGIHTMVEKCSWASPREAFCAVPRLILQEWTLPDDYLQGTINPPDRLVQIDLTKKTIEEILNEGEFDMTNLLVTKKKEYLFFVNRLDGTLWRLKLK